MSFHSKVAKSVRESKERHPENFCPSKNCLYRTGGGFCPKHGGPPKVTKNNK